MEPDDAADDAIVEALDAKGNRRLREIRAAEHERGLAHGRVEAIESACRLLGITVDIERRAFLLTCNATTLEQLLIKIESTRRWAGP